MYILGNKFNSKSQQIDENTKDIAELKEIVKTPAIIYNASVEISADVGTVNSSDIIQTIESIDNAFILDTVGSLFRIVDVVENTIYIMYVSSIRGQTGATGATGANGADGASVSDVNFEFIETVSAGNKYDIQTILSNGDVIHSGDVILPNLNASYTNINLDETKVTGGYVRYFRYGNIVICEFNAMIFANLSGIVSLYDQSRFPKTINGENIQFTLTSEASSKPVIRLRIDLNGQLQLNDTINNNNKYYGVFAYLCKD